MSASTPPSYRCSTCKSGTGSPKNLAVFIDGTSNKPGPKKTNVMKLYETISDANGSQPEQRKLYLEGIGTYDDHLSLLSRAGKATYGLFEMMLAWNVEKNVQEAYKFLVENYAEGDRIYLFGFSRGAYQVRALAGMIHEVGLLKHETKDRIERAYQRYISIKPNDPETRKAAIEFRKDFCLQGLRVHFVGVWDTVSSLGFIKRDVHITASASVTNACHFRHALSLDERRVKFMPEYFSEMNVHCIEIRSPRPLVGDVKEVWFAGCHSDVGGANRPPRTEGVSNLVRDEHAVHAGNVPLLWMRREAASQGLVIDSQEFAWYPEDVDLGRKDSMELGYKFLEILPIRHQVSFSGVGTHKQRWHLSHPRLIIPGQHVHFSILTSVVYTPKATLTHGVDIPTVPQGALNGLSAIELWKPEPLDEETMSRLKSLLRKQQDTLRALGEVLLLLDFGIDNGKTIPDPEWSVTSIREHSGFDKFVLVLIYDAINDSSISDPDGLLKDAKDYLKGVLSSPTQQYPPGFFYVLHFLARHKDMRQRFIADDQVIKGLIHALKPTAESPMENLFALVVDILCHLISDDDQRARVISQLTAPITPEDATTSVGVTTESTWVSLALGVKAPGHLIASRKLIVTLAQYSLSLKEDLRNNLKSKVLKLAKQERGPVSWAAVKALVELSKPLTLDEKDIHISNILGYLGDILPRLDAEVGDTSSTDVVPMSPPVSEVDGAGITSTSSPVVTVSLFSVLQDNSTGPCKLDENDAIVCKLLHIIESGGAHERTAATFTLLKLCMKYPIVWRFCSEENVLAIFRSLLERKEASLLAAYALNTCLKRKIWMPGQFPRAPENIKTMFDKGLFDDAVGRIEGSVIFRELMTSGNLRQEVIRLGIVTTIIKQLEIGKHHAVRMSLICLDALEGGPVNLKPIVIQSIDNLKNSSKGTQKKGIKVLSALALTKAGERVIEPQVESIVKLLVVPPPGHSSIPRSQLFGASAVLHNLCRNETLRDKIRNNEDYCTFAHRRRDVQSPRT